MASAAATADLAAHESKDVLRFITCGSVDDGKSTLIGRILYDSRTLADDQMKMLEGDSRRFGTTGAGELDLALLVDGLAAEREQGITIDVAYRYFSTRRRKFIVADTPGHEQYTRNMATGASTAHLAVLLVDGRKGVLTQSRRHSHIVSLLGIRQLVLAVNKMDLVGYDRSVFQQIESDYRAFAAGLGFDRIEAIPMVAVTGENVAGPAGNMAWYRGPSLLEHLETVSIEPRQVQEPFCMSVQWVNRQSQAFRGYAGTVAGGSLAVSDEVVILPSGARTQIESIQGLDGALDSCRAGDAVTLVLSDDIDVGRGDVFASPENPPDVADQFSAHVVWMDNETLLPGRRYIIRIGSATVGATVTVIRYRLDVNTHEQTAVRYLNLNDVAVCNLSLDRPLPIVCYKDSRELGGFILIDRVTNATVGCGMIDFALRRSANIRWQAMKIDKQARARIFRQKPCVLWFTGLSGAGKSTIADLVEQRLHQLGRHTMSLDGDNVRHGLNRDLGFTDQDRVENIRRVAEVGRLMVEAGLITLVSFISPFRSERQMARDMLGPDEFVEIFVDAPLSVCERRDTKGLYKKARAGNLPNFTGIDSPYEPPLEPDLRLAAGEGEAVDLADAVIVYLQRREII
jgi:bifunctional enzyme CysN/CysC